MYEWDIEFTHLAQKLLFKKVTTQLKREKQKKYIHACLTLDENKDTLQYEERTLVFVCVFVLTRKGKHNTNTPTLTTRILCHCEYKFLFFVIQFYG